jgi:NAD(P)-dependent dehydrogenase (short-subunit alcohol dehydrogenase family)
MLACARAIYKCPPEDGMDTEAGTPLAGQVAIVTGGASGIGQEIVRTLIDAGASAAIVDVDGAGAEQLAASLGGRTTAVCADVSDADDVQRLVDETVAAFGKATILVHAAAPPERSGAALDMAPEAWARVVAVILTGGYLVARAFAAQVIRQGGGGRIVNIVSTVVESPRVESSAYCSAKTGLVALTRVLAMELAPHAITVNAVGPGLTLTPTVMARGLESYNAAFLKQVPLGRLCEPRDVAGAVRFFCSPLASYVTGQTLYVDGGYLAGKLSVRA